MKISLITTLASLIENKRIKEEVENLGHEFELINLVDFGFCVKNGVFTAKGLTNIEADLVIVRGIFNSLKPISTVIKNLRKKGVRVFDNNLASHQYSIDKITDLVKLSLAKIPVPNTCYTRNFAEFPELARQIGYPVVVKTTRMGKGAGVYKFEKEASLLGFVEDAKNEGKEAKSYLIQEFIPYKYDLRSLIIGEEVFTMRRIPAKGEFRANFSLGGEVEVFSLDEAGRDLAKKALAAIGMSVGGVDILMTEDDRRYILEVNHTAGFVGMEKATGKNIGKIYVEYAIEKAR